MAAVVSKFVVAALHAEPSHGLVDGDHVNGLDFDERRIGELRHRESLMARRLFKRAILVGNEANARMRIRRPMTDVRGRTHTLIPASGALFGDVQHPALGVGSARRRGKAARRAGKVRAMPARRARSLVVSLLLFVGLLCMGASFVMLDRGWLARPPVMGVRHPVAFAVGAFGALLCLAAVAWRRWVEPRSSKG